MFRFLRPLICAVLLAGAGQAADYHVAQLHADADDANPGTPEKPFRTITAALPSLKAGDTLWIHAGTYRESVVLMQEDWTWDGHTYPAFPSGTGISASIRLFAAPGEQATIKGSDVVTGWVRHRDAVWVRESWPVNSQTVFCDGRSLQQIGGKLPEVLATNWKGKKGETLDDLEPGSFFVDTDARKLYVWLPDGGDPNEHLMEAGVRPFLLLTNCEYIHIAGLHLLHGHSSARISWPSCWLHGAHNVMEDCTIEWCDFIGLSLSGYDNTVRRCRLNHNGNSGMGGGGWDNRVLDCEVSWNNWRRWSPSWHAGGMKIIPSAHGWTVSGCTVEHNIESDGIWFDAANANILIQNNLCRYNDGNGIHYEISERGLIRNNVCIQNKGRGIYLSSSSDTIILHNLCISNGQSGICSLGVNRAGGFSVDPETGYEPARNNIIWGNILMENCHPDLAPAGPDHTGNPWTKRPELILPDPRISSNTGCVSDYNLFWRASGRAMPFWHNWGAEIFSDLEDWQARTGQDRHSRMAEPLFVDAALGDFHPAKGSPAIQMVHPRSAIFFDKDGKQRPLFEDAFLTAGPYEAPKEFRTPVARKEAASTSIRTVALPADAAELTGPLAAALATLPRADLPDAKRGATLQGIPFAFSEPAQAIVLDRNHPRARLPVGWRARELYLLHAVLSPGRGVQSRCLILRDDGATLPLRWEAGKNLAPSLGPWSGELTEKLSPPIEGWTSDDSRQDQTQIAWEGTVGDTPARFFLTTWKNQNEWLPVRELSWVLEEESATVVILGISLLALD